MKHSLIRWPGGDDRYHDTGEGGLFAWMVVPAEADKPGVDNCAVDTHLYLTRPDVMVSHAPEMWEPSDYRNTGWDRIERARDALKTLPGHEEAAEGLVEVMGRDELSQALRAAVFLGSTPCSYNRNNGTGYFQATAEHLTLEGLRIYDGLQFAFGTTPQILTFLDT